jgi:hypothetical protein
MGGRVMARYRVRPRGIEAIQFTGDNVTDIRAFTGYETDEAEAVEADASLLILETDEADLTAQPGDWIVKRDGALFCFSNALFVDFYESAEA